MSPYPLVRSYYRHALSVATPSSYIVITVKPRLIRSVRLRPITSNLRDSSCGRRRGGFASDSRLKLRPKRHQHRCRLRRHLRLRVQKYVLRHRHRLLACLFEWPVHRPCIGTASQAYCLYRQQSRSLTAHLSLVAIFNNTVTSQAKSTIARHCQRQRTALWTLDNLCDRIVCRR